MNSSVLKKAIEHLKHYGLHDFTYKVLETIHDKRNDKYCWNEIAPSEAELELQRNTELEYQPKVSILVPTYETKPVFLMQLLDSIIAQTYSEWELCLADASSTDAVEKLVLRYKSMLSEEQSGRIKYQKLTENGGISDNTNRAYEMATGEFIGLLDHDDMLAPNALYEMVSAINAVEAASRSGVMLYSDEDKIDEEGNKHFYPHLKLDFNLEYLRTNNYICHFLVVSNALVGAAGGWRKMFDGAQDYDFILRCSEKAESIIHVPKILYHWRVSDTSTAGDKYTKLYAYEAGRKAIEEHLRRCGESGTVSILKELGTYKVNYDAVSVDEELVSLEEIASHIDKYVTFVVINSVCDINACGDIKTPFIMFIKESMGGDAARKLAEQLIQYMGRKTIAAVAPKEVYKGHIVQNGICMSADGKVYQLFNGLNKNYKGYFKRAALPQNAEGIMYGAALTRTNVIKDVIQDGIIDEWMLSREIINRGFELIQASDITNGD